MKKLTATGLALVSALAVQAAKIEQVIVRQQWPWSTDVKVEYRLSDVTTPVNISVRAFNGETELPLPEQAIAGDLYGIVEDGVGQFVIDPVAAFGNAKIALADFRVKLALSDGDADSLNEVLYRVYNLVSGTRTDITRKELLNRKYGSCERSYTTFGEGFATPLEDVLVWTGVTNDLAYMTTNLVLRKIPATSQVWRVGDSDSVESLPPKFVKLTEDYFIGVFPLTAEQHRLITGGAMETALTEAMALPKDSLSVNVMRGTRTPTGSGKNLLLGMKTQEPIFWPTNSYVHDVGGNTVLASLRKKFDIDFDLPSEAQWEVACRAGSTTPLYDGKPNGTGVEALGWISTNSGKALQRVGLKAPNAWGLYDLYGNVFELTSCLAGWDEDQANAGETEAAPLVDPLGSAPTGGSDYIFKRGGSAEQNKSWATSSARNYWFGWSEVKPFVGCRLVVPADGTAWKQ